MIAAAGKDLLWDQFYWPTMEGDAEEHIQIREHCLRFKVKPARAELQPIKAIYLLDLVYMEYLTIELGEGNKDVSILVITDHFMRYAQVIVTNMQ